MRKLCVAGCSSCLCGAAGPVGCASAPYSAVRAPLGGDHVPPDVTYYRATIDGAGGVKLLEQCWQPTRRRRARRWCWCTISRTTAAATASSACCLPIAGTPLCAIDLRGHGYSEGVRDHINSLESFGRTWIG